MARRSKKEEVDLNESLIDFIKAGAPRGEGSDDVTWDVSRTRDVILSQVKYIIKTGIDSFDTIVGGMPVGRATELFGLESCGKTAMAIRCAANAIRKNVYEVKHAEDGSAVYEKLDPEMCDVRVVYIDNEQSLDDDNKLVVDGEKIDILGCRFDTTDDMFKAIDRAIKWQKAMMEKTEKDGILRFMLIVVDTIASTSTRQEIDRAWGEADFPRQPQQISAALRRLTRFINRMNICMLFTNQVRTKFSAAPKKGGGPTLQISASDYSSPGGMALRYYCSHRVFMYALAQKYKLVPDARFPAGINIGFVTIKNRSRMPQREGRMVLLFDQKNGGLHNSLSMLETMINHGFVELEAKEKQTGFKFKFQRNGIETSTFDRATTLEEDEDRVARRKKDPGFKYRAEWFQFYEEHKADVDLLWEATIKAAMTVDGMEGGLVVVEDDDEANQPFE